jgi:hypothetical protein
MRSRPMAKKCGDKALKEIKTYSCSKCGATANKKEKLCKPAK